MTAHETEVLRSSPEEPAREMSERSSRPRPRTTHPAHLQAPQVTNRAATRWALDRRSSA
jgi:hypothetical protein